jgi:hypothetical protein
MDLTEGSETSAKLNLTPQKYPKENIQDSEHGEYLKSRSILNMHLGFVSRQGRKNLFYPKTFAPAQGPTLLPVQSVEFLVIFFGGGGGGQQIQLRIEGKENGGLGAVAP